MITIPKIPKGKKRQWIECNHGNVYHYDYVPFSLSNPITTIDCGCRLHKDTKCITADEAIISLN